MNPPRNATIACFLTLAMTAAAPGTCGQTEPDSQPAAAAGFRWNDALPLPRHRLGPDGRNATPAPPDDQPTAPYRIALPAFDAAPDACGKVSPPEYASVHAVLLRYRSGDFDEVVTDIVAKLTGDPLSDERAYVVVSSPSQQQAAESDFAAAGADLSRVDFFIAPSNSVWMRDYGPHFSWQGGAEAIVDSHYYPNRDDDNFIPTRLADDEFISPSHDMPLYYSGGNFQAADSRDGFITRLIFADNPDLTEDDVSDLYGRFQGIDTLHVFPQLPSSVDGTGHIDMWLYLVDQNTVIISEFLPGSNPTAIDITEDAVVYMQNLGYEVFRVPAFNASHPVNPGTHFTYTNAFRVNDRIFVPTYADGEPAYQTYDDQALAAWKAAAGPGVEIVTIPSYDIIWASGAIHCIVKQVPRYVETVPSACVTFPSGGEWLVPGAQSEITWTATDDDAVTSIDLLYSTDGGESFPPEQSIATGLADTGRYPWSVPLVESDAARVRVVARDGSGGVVRSDSEADLTFDSGLRRVYDLGSGAGIDRYVYGSETGSWSAVDRVRLPVDTEISSADYAALAASDATGDDSDPNRYVAPVPGFFGESTHVVELTLDEDPALITDLEILVEGYGDGCSQLEVYLWDHVESQWCDGAGRCGRNRHLANYAGQREETLRRSVRSSFDRYLDASGMLTLLLYVERSRDELLLDYLAVTVTSDPCPGPDRDLDGYADDCDNCVATSNTGQENQDGDARGDACDCAEADPGAFAIPLEIGNVMLSPDGSTLSWDSAAANSGSGTIYSVVRGLATELPVGSGPGETCAGSGLSDTSLSGLADPAAATVDTYLVRGENACGAGTYGNATDGTERTSEACP